MESTVLLQFDGQAVLQSDYNAMGASAGHADDNVLAELLRTVPYGSTVARGIIPPTHDALIAPNGATGTVLVNSFRAVIGSRTTFGADPKANYRDIRSAIFVGPASVAIAANASGNPRWDAILAAVTIDTGSATVVRKVKSPTTSVVSDQNVSVSLVTTVAISVVTGTPAASPVFPTTTPDSGSTYYVVLGYVRVPTGFTSASTVSASLDIAICGPVLTLARATGASSTSVASSNVALTTAAQQAWGPFGGRPTGFAPSTMTGTESLWVLLDLSSATLGAHSHQDGDVIDSRDWRGRLSTYMASVSPITGVAAWDRTPSAANVTPNGFPQGFAAASNKIAVGLGQTMVTDAALVAGTSTPFQISNGVSTNLGITQLGIVCDATTGALKLFAPGNARCIIAVRLDFSGPFSNVL